jgi:hypothetical protein
MMSISIGLVYTSNIVSIGLVQRNPGRFSSADVHKESDTKRPKGQSAKHLVGWDCLDKK